MMEEISHEVKATNRPRGLGIEMTQAGRMKKRRGVTMNKGTKWIYMIVGGIVAIGLITGAGVLYLRSEAANIRSQAAEQGAPTDLTTMWLNNGDRSQGDYLEALAQALGISVEKLQEAMEGAFEAAIDEAVSSGDLSSEQAERLLDHGTFMMPGPRVPRGMNPEMKEFLASELGISVSALEAAQAEAHEILMAQAIETGDLSEEQAEVMRAQQALRPFLQTAMEEAFENAVASALNEGAITQAQADLLLELDRPANRSEGMFPGMRGRGGLIPRQRFFGTDES
jgi:polyhydroxyalkanoate synthesis regulator phasin